MNKFLINKLTGCCMLLALLLSAGCEKMDDIQKEFVQRGETTYTAKADSLKAFGGYKRLQLSWLLLSDPKIHKYKLYWNNRRDSIESTVVKSANVDTVKLMMNPMEEGTYHFEVFTYDKVGNSSVKSTIVGKVYGDRYAGSLLPRTVRRIKRIDEHTLELEWTTGDEELAQVQLEYRDRAGVLRKLKIPRKEDFTPLEDFPFGGSWKARSVFLPEKQALDTFFTGYADKKVTVTDTIYWKNYNLVFGHLDNILARQANGDFMQLDKNGQGFNFARRIGVGWQGFNTIFSLAEGVIARLADGNVRYYPLAKLGTVGTMKVVGSGFQTFTQLFAYGNNIYIRKTNGELWKYPFDAATTTLGTTTLLPGGTTWNQYDKILGVDNALIGRKPDGTLWFIPVNANGSFGTAVKIADGWNQFNLIANHKEGLMARKANGDLFYYPILANGTLGTAKEIFVVSETL